jgi:predicted dehydrogenase
MPHRREIEIVGSTAFLRIANPWHPQPDGVELWRDGATVPEIISTPPADSYALQVADLGAAIDGEREPLLGRQDAFGQARTIEALYASAATGSVVTL